MTDAATGGRAILGRAIEKDVLGVPQGTFQFLNFDSVDITRLDDENKSGAITGHEGMDQGTPADIKFDDKLKYSMTASRILFDLVAMFGKPTSVVPVGGNAIEPTSLTITAAGDTYETGDPVVITDGGSGAGAAATVVSDLGKLLVSTFALGGGGTTGYVTGQVINVTDAGGGSGAIVRVVASAGQVTGITIEDVGRDYVTPLLDFTLIGDGTATGTISAGTGFVTDIVFSSYGLGYTSPVLNLAGSGDGNATATVSSDAAAWLVKIRPDALNNDVRAATLYLFEGGHYTATAQTGRRTADISIADAANKRAEVTVTYSDPTGDTISGFLVGKSDNGNAAFRAQTFGMKIFTRGRRPYDAAFDAGDSLYLIITAIDTTSGAESVTFQAGYAAASGDVDGTGFPTPAYSTVEFTCPVASADFDGYTAVVMDAPLGTIGLFGENFEAFEVCIPPVADLANLTVGDEFEIPVEMPALTKTVTPETRLSAFHLIRKLNGSTDVRIDKGATKIVRPYKPYRANGRRIPQAIDPSGDSSATFTFSKRLFDRFFRKISDAHTRFSVYDNYRNESPIAGTTAHESVEIFAPQCAVTALKSGEIATKDVLEESVTLFAEQPNVVPTPPAGFDASADYPIQINITTLVDPTWLL